MSSKVLIASFALFTFYAPAGDVVAAPSPQPSTASAGEETADSAFVKAKVMVDGKAYEHPGFRIDHETESVLTIEAGGKTHEVVVLIKEKAGKRYTVDAEYLRNGKSMAKVVDHGMGEKKFVMVEGKFGIYIDPFGQPDKSRKKKIDGPKGENPLD